MTLSKNQPPARKIIEWFFISRQVYAMFRTKCEVFNRKNKLEIILPQQEHHLTNRVEVKIVVSPMVEKIVKLYFVGKKGYLQNKYVHLHLKISNEHRRECSCIKYGKTLTANL
jgi:hypothetical protein